MKFLLGGILLVVIPSISYSQIDYDTNTVYTDFNAFFNRQEMGSILRTNNIRFTIVNRELDTANVKTIQFLDSLAFFLNQTQISLEVGTHISIKHSQKSARNYNNMSEGIVNYLVKKGVSGEQLVRKNYLDTSPILRLSDKSKFNNEEKFWELEWETNNRVEFKILSQK